MSAPKITVAIIASPCAPTACHGLVYNSGTDFLLLAFATAPTEGSLVGFTGGAIDGFRVIPPIGAPLYVNLTATITAVPEPPLVFGLARRFGEKSAIH